MKHSNSLYILFVILFALFAGQPVLAAGSPGDAASPSQVNINTASAEDLAGSLKGVGLKKARAIIEYRDKFGDFKVIEELAEVKGIGPSTIEKNRSRIGL